jgi:DNA polymerase I
LPATQRGYSTDEKFLTQYEGKVRLVDHVLAWREPAKLDGTYVLPLLTGEILGVDGMPHPKYTVVLTATGRLSAEDPNIQNYPKRKNREIRRMFVAPPGHLYVCFDYGQLEARVLAMTSKDRALIRSIINKDDIHAKWLHRMLDLFGGYYDIVAHKSGETIEKEVLKAARDRIKNDFVFASFYGSWSSSIAANTGVPVKIIEQLWGEFWSEYKGVQDWHTKVRTEYEQYGCVSTLTGMVRNELMGGNEPINTPVQGTAAHLVLEAQNALCAKSIETDDRSYRPRLNIHDDLGFFMRDDSGIERYIETTAAEIVLPRFKFQCVPLMTECRIGPNFADLEPVGKFEGSYFPL